MLPVIYVIALMGILWQQQCKERSRRYLLSTKHISERPLKKKSKYFQNSQILEEKEGKRNYKWRQRSHIKWDIKRNCQKRACEW